MRAFLQPDIVEFIWLSLAKSKRCFSVLDTGRFHCSRCQKKSRQKQQASS